ncbi:hypothetical protein [Flavobacterium sp. SLB02]|uniref:hypothetical protein n=1 Tax=Flavobacterium sp. SLB02 TaxID=2665645 RepID=UPI0012A922DE|nr:hypothetical protein [Flavobacterium sp. SLB02]QGK73194.1 hypothetical protein GIY83_03680 [Flavobacterium sp. SLB02]
MIDFNLIFNEAKKTESFWDFSQNWFDVLTLVLTILSLWLAYWLGEKGYKRDKKDKLDEQKQLIATEVNLFKINLEQLLEAISNQLTALEDYKVKQNFSLKYYPDLHVDFLKFINPKFIYEHIGFQNANQINEFNELLRSLYGLNDIKLSIKDSVRNYILRYNELEKGFYLYRKLMYKMMHEIVSRNIDDLIPVEGGFQINFGTNEFARQFFQLNESVLENPELLDENKQLIRPKLIELFVLPTIEICKQFIPINADAIEVADVANEVNSSWVNMETITNAHFNEIDGHIAILENVRDEITEYLQ